MSASGRRADACSSNDEIHKPSASASSAIFALIALCTPISTAACSPRRRSRIEVEGRIMSATWLPGRRGDPADPMVIHARNPSVGSSPGAVLLEGVGDGVDDVEVKRADEEDDQDRHEAVGEGCE